MGLCYVLAAQSCLTLCNTWTAALQVPLPREFSRHEYWSGLPFSSPGDLPNPGMEPMAPRCRQILYRLSHTHDGISALITRGVGGICL